MNVSLTPELESYIRHKLASGLYGSASEIIREALRLLEERDRVLGARVDNLRAEIRKGIESLESGRSSPFDEDTVRRIKSAGQRRLRAGRKKRA